jgi:hypothetical protein
MPFDRTQPYAIVSGHGGEYYLQGGQAYSLTGLAISEPDLSDPVEEGGGGASAFTDLSDAPATITPHSVVVGNAEGDGLECSSDATVTAVQTAESRLISSGLIYKATGVDGINPVAQTSLTATSSYGGETEEEEIEAGSAEAVLAAQVSTDGGGLVQLELKAVSEQDDQGGGTKTVVITKTAAADFMMVNFDVVASDVDMRLTVSGVEYSVGRAIKVVAGDGTYFWPLFGPVAP